MNIATKPARILLAEDDAELRELLALSLREAGYEVIEARDGNELVDRLAACLLGRSHDSDYDLVVSDVRMPGYTGIDVLVALRRKLPQIPMILITGFGDSATHARAKRLGATMVFDKPFDLDDLRSAVGGVLAQTKPDTGPVT